MTSVASEGVRFHPGTQTTAAQAIHTTPLGYDRASCPTGSALPVPASAELVDRLGECREIEVAFHGKLGDTLLALSAVRALTDWLNLRSTPVAVHAVGPYAGLLARTGLITQAPTAAALGRRAVITDRSTTKTLAPADAVTLVCDPAAPPCWSSNGHTYPDMPARHYLALERRLGVRLPGNTPFTPSLATRHNGLVEELRSTGWLSGLTIAAIAATSWPERKDYTAQRFVELADHIATAHGSRVRLLLIGGQTGGGTRIAVEAARRHVPILRLDGALADDLADLFPHCRLVIGNDTGLTHLAAMARDSNASGPPVVGLYARHSHTKWRTGLPHHHAVATNLSHRMHQGDLCPVRDSIAPDTGVHMDAFPPAALAQICLDLLNGADE